MESLKSKFKTEDIFRRQTKAPEPTRKPLVGDVPTRLELNVKRRRDLDEEMEWDQITDPAFIFDTKTVREARKNTKQGGIRE